MFYSVYTSKHCKEPIDKLKYGMYLSEFLEYKDYVDIQSSVDMAIHKDQELDLKRAK
jgi:hypothetical protein